MKNFLAVLLITIIAADSCFGQASRATRAPAPPRITTPGRSGPTRQQGAPLRPIPTRAPQNGSPTRQQGVPVPTRAPPGVAPPPQPTRAPPPLPPGVVPPPQPTRAPPPLPPGVVPPPQPTRAPPPLPPGVVPPPQPTRAPPPLPPGIVPPPAPVPPVPQPPLPTAPSLPTSVNPNFPDGISVPTASVPQRTTTRPPRIGVQGIPNPRCPVNQNPRNPVHLPHETNCERFYKCDHGLAYEYQCPVGQHWNARRNYCDFPNLANCQSNGNWNNPNNNWNNPPSWDNPWDRPPTWNNPPSNNWQNPPSWNNPPQSWDNQIPQVPNFQHPIIIPMAP